MGHIWPPNIIYVIALTTLTLLHILLDKQLQMRYISYYRSLVWRIDETVHARHSYRRTQEREKAEFIISLAGLTVFPRHI
jgi:hypothetical protein